MKFYNWIPFISFLFIGFVLSVRVYLLRKKGVQVSAGKKKKTANSLYLFFLIILLLWLVEISRPAFDFSFSILPDLIIKLIIDNHFLKFTGAFVIAVALILFMLTLILFKNSLRFGFDEKNKGVLITSGIFSISRNPFFLSLDIYFIGIALLLPNLFFIGFSILAIVVIHFFILKEEKLMLKMYGAEYEKYTKKTPRYF